MHQSSSMLCPRPCHSCDDFRGLGWFMVQGQRALKLDLSTMAIKHILYCITLNLFIPLTEQPLNRKARLKFAQDARQPPRDMDSRDDDSRGHTRSCSSLRDTPLLEPQKGVAMVQKCLKRSPGSFPMFSICPHYKSK